MKIKHLGRKLLSLVLSAALAIPLSLPALAETDITGGDGQTGVDGSWAANYYPGEDGVRVTLVNDSGTAVSGSIDYTLNKNNCASKVELHFGKHCKSYYRNQGYQAIMPVQTDYSWRTPPTTNSSDKFPEPVISDNGSTTYLATKAYFRNETVQVQVLKDISSVSKTNFSWKDDLESGKYQLMLEPILYFDYNGVYYAGTATELALFHKSNPAGFSDLGPAYRYNAPNAMYLESGRGGFEAATYSDRQANIVISSSGFKYYDVDYIAKYMGVGFVYYEAAPVAEATAYTYKYISTRYVPQGYTVDQMEAMALADQLSLSPTEESGEWIRSEKPVTAVSSGGKFMASACADSSISKNGILVNVSRTDSEWLNSQYPADWMSGVSIKADLLSGGYFISGGDTYPDRSQVEDRSTAQNSLSFVAGAQYHIAYYQIIWVNPESYVYNHVYTANFKLNPGIDASYARSQGLDYIRKNSTEEAPTWTLETVFTIKGTSQVSIGASKSLGSLVGVEVKPKSYHENSEVYPQLSSSSSYYRDNSGFSWVNTSKNTIKYIKNLGSVMVSPTGGCSVHTLTYRYNVTTTPVTVNFHTYNLTIDSSTNNVIDITGPSTSTTTKTGLINYNPWNDPNIPKGDIVRITTTGSPGQTKGRLPVKDNPPPSALTSYYIPVQANKVTQIDVYIIRGLHTGEIHSYDLNNFNDFSEDAQYFGVNANDAKIFANREMVTKQVANSNSFSSLYLASYMKSNFTTDAFSSKYSMPSSVYVNKKPLYNISENTVDAWVNSSFGTMHRFEIGRTTNGRVDETTPNSIRLATKYGDIHIDNNYLVAKKSLTSSTSSNITLNSAGENDNFKSTYTLKDVSEEYIFEPAVAMAYDDNGDNNKVAWVLSTQPRKIQFTNQLNVSLVTNGSSSSSTDYVTTVSSEWSTEKQDLDNANGLPTMKAGSAYQTETKGAGVRLTAYVVLQDPNYATNSSIVQSTNKSTLEAYANQIKAIADSISKNVAMYTNLTNGSTANASMGIQETSSSTFNKEQMKFESTISTKLDFNTGSSASTSADITDFDGWTFYALPGQVVTNQYNNSKLDDNKDISVTTSSRTSNLFGTGVKTISTAPNDAVIKSLNTYLCNFLADQGKPNKTNINDLNWYNEDYEGFVVAKCDVIVEIGTGSGKNFSNSVKTNFASVYRDQSDWRTAVNETATTLKSGGKQVIPAKIFGIGMEINNVPLNFGSQDLGTKSLYFQPTYFNVRGSVYDTAG